MSSAPSVLCVAMCSDMVARIAMETDGSSVGIMWGCTWEDPAAAAGRSHWEACLRGDWKTVWNTGGLLRTDCSFIVSTAGDALWAASRGLAQRGLWTRGTAAGRRTCHRTTWSRPFFRPWCTVHDTSGTASDLWLCGRQLQAGKMWKMLTIITTQPIQNAKR